MLDEDTLTRDDFIPAENDIPVIKQHMTDIENELRRLEESISQMQTLHSQRSNVLQRLRYAIAPARRVPAEILTQIYQWLLLKHEEEDPNATQICIPWQASRRPWQVELLHICSLWRRAALDAHFLWYNLMLVTPASRCDLVSGDWNGHVWCERDLDRWMTSFNIAREMLPTFGSIIIGIDLEKSGQNYQLACQLAIEHLYNPLVDAGRHVSALSIRGYYDQLKSIFDMQLHNPESLEHLILRDMGDHDILDEPTNDGLERFFNAAPNLRKLDLIGENEASILLDDTIGDDFAIPWERLTHLTIKHPFDATGYDTEIDAVLGIPRACKNLVHLTLLVGLINDYDDRWPIEQDDLLVLPFLQTLIVSFDMHQFFLHLRVRSLLHLEIRTHFRNPLEHITEFIAESECSIQKFVEIHTEKSPLYGIYIAKRTDQPSFDHLLESLHDARTFRTITELAQHDLENIASGRFLPHVKALQFYTNLPINQVLRTLRPRLKNKYNSQQTQASTGLDEVVVNYYTDSTYLIPDCEVDGTSVRTLYEGPYLHRIKGSG